MDKFLELPTPAVLYLLSWGPAGLWPSSQQQACLSTSVLSLCTWVCRDVPWKITQLCQVMSLLLVVSKQLGVDAAVGGGQGPLSTSRKLPFPFSLGAIFNFHSFLLLLGYPFPTYLPPTLSGWPWLRLQRKQKSPGQTPQLADHFPSNLILSVHVSLLSSYQKKSYFSVVEWMLVSLQIHTLKL